MKRFLLFWMLILWGTILGAQSRWAFGLDIEGGLSGNKEVNDDAYHNSTFGTYNYRTAILRRPGMSAGIWTEYLLSHRFGLRLGMNYAKLGVFSETEGTDYNAANVITSFSQNRLDIRQSQWRIPLEGKLYFGPSDRRVRSFISLGAQTSYLISQTMFSSSYQGNAGFEAYENSFASEADLDNEYVDIQRWQISLLTGIGITGDRFTLSLQRTWGAKQDEYSVYGGGLCNCALCDCAFPMNGGQGIRQLQLTSFRFAYHLF